MTNPFKFCSVVDDPFFTNRVDEMAKVKQILESNNHLVMISPRRFGKTSLIRKAVKNLKRDVLSLDLQLVSGVEDFASQYLKRIYRLFPSEKIKHLIKNFRIIPSLSLNPVNNEVDISFQTTNSTLPLLEDVLNLLEQLCNSKHRAIVILDEFQEVMKLELGFDKKLRSIMQLHKNINYVFLGSQESMMREIFEKKKSPFYHFGLFFQLQKIEKSQFRIFLITGLKSICKQPEKVAEDILLFTEGHPYYTQQLAYTVWNNLNQKAEPAHAVNNAIEETIQTHDLDYERLWNTFNKTDKKTIIGLSQGEYSPLSQSVLNKNNSVATSTIFSSLKRLMQNGYVIKTSKGYEIDDPFFNKWTIKRREL